MNPADAAWTPSRAPIDSYRHPTGLIPHTAWSALDRYRAGADPQLLAARRRPSDFATRLAAISDTCPMQPGYPGASRRLRRHPAFPSAFEAVWNRCGTSGPHRRSASGPVLLASVGVEHKTGKAHTLGRLSPWSEPPAAAGKSCIWLQPALSRSVQGTGLCTDRQAAVKYNLQHHQYYRHSLEQQPAQQGRACVWHPTRDSNPRPSA